MYARKNDPLLQPLLREGQALRQRLGRPLVHSQLLPPIARGCWMVVLRLRFEGFRESSACMTAEGGALMASRRRWMFRRRRCPGVVQNKHSRGEARDSKREQRRAGRRQVNCGIIRRSWIVRARNQRRAVSRERVAPAVACGCSQLAELWSLALHRARPVRDLLGSGRRAS
jgi:hypothetical protein